MDRVAEDKSCADMTLSSISWKGCGTRDMMINYRENERKKVAAFGLVIISPFKINISSQILVCPM